MNFALAGTKQNAHGKHESLKPLSKMCRGKQDRMHKASMRESETFEQTVHYALLWAQFHKYGRGSFILACSSSLRRGFCTSVLLILFAITLIFRQLQEVA